MRATDVFPLSLCVYFLCAQIVGLPVWTSCSFLQNDVCESIIQVLL